MSNVFRIASVVVCLLISEFVQAQGQATGNSPYSQIGLGDLNPSAFTPNQGMGGTGVSHTDSLFYNNTNPALLGRNNFRRTSLDVGITGQWKQLSTKQTSQQQGGGNLGYIAFAFPVMSRWTIGAGIAPYSTVNYNISQTRTDPTANNTPVNYLYKGSGGLTGVTISNGIHLIKNKTAGLYVGLQTQYIFGAINYESVSTLADTAIKDIKYGIAYINRTNHSGFLFKPGIAYRHPLVKDKVFLNVGGTYDIPLDVKTKRLDRFETRTSDGLPITDADTIGTEIRGTVHLPAQYRLGVSIDRPFRWAVAADISYQQWNSYTSSTEQRSVSSTYSYQNSYSAHLGGEFIPNINSLRGYFNRVVYRVGGTYAQMPIAFQGKQLTDMSVSVGASFPINRDFTGIHLALTYGQRGTLDNGLIKEQYLRATLGISIIDLWFRRSRID
jgi:hypothetical protein